MSAIDTSMTLGALVTAHPQLAREFELRQFDYCCGGARTLGEVCAERGLDAAMVADDMGGMLGDETTADWASMGATELVDHLEATHHRYLWDELPRLSALVAKVVSVHVDRHPELIAIKTCFDEIQRDLEPHLLKEERVLFPMIRELELASGPMAFHCGTLRNPISMMLREHDAVGEYLARLRRLTSGYQPPADGCASFVACYAGLAELEADTHLHIHKENNLLFPMVVQMEAEVAARG